MKSIKSIPMIGLGAGGHARVVLDIVRSMDGYTCQGLLDRQARLWGQQLDGVPILGDDTRLPQLYADGIRHVFIGVGATGSTQVRRTLYQHARDIGFDVVTIVHPRATIAATASYGNGITMMAHAVVNAGAQLGVNVVVNTGAIIEHDCVIGDHAHIATGACLSSTVHVGVGAHIGAGVTVRQCVSIGDEAIVGAGAVVIRDVPPRAVVAGVPARPLKHQQRSVDKMMSLNSEER